MQLATVRGQLVILLVCAVIMIAPPVLSAASPQAEARSQSAAAVLDIELGPGGILAGLTVDQQGQPLKGNVVVLAQDGKVVAKTLSDDHGQFRFEQLRGGVYGLETGQVGQLCRLWMQNTAPPAAKSRLLVVADGQIARGQSVPSRVYNWFEGKPFIGYALVATAITVPIVVANDSDSGS